jgi:hypothetical protein
MTTFFHEWFRAKPKDVRRAEVARVTSKYFDKVPVIVAAGTQHTPDLKEHKYLVPKEFTMGQLQYTIRSRLNLKPDQALFMFVVRFSRNMDEVLEEFMPVASKLVGQVYNENNHEGYLCVKYMLESTFG